MAPKKVLLGDKSHPFYTKENLQICFPISLSHVGKWAMDWKTIDDDEKIFNTSSEKDDIVDWIFLYWDAVYAEETIISFLKKFKYFDL